MKLTQKRRRPGAATIETAMVMLPLLMILFGVFEYGRLLMDWNIVNNAAREGCRYAIVNNTSTTLNSDVATVVKNYIGIETRSFTSINVTVNGVHQGTTTPLANLMPGDLISVSVSGQYRFLNVIPAVKMPALTISSAATMVCEGGT